MPRSKTLSELTNLDLRLMRVFDAVARAGSFAGAEVLLNKSKSSISTDIASLESRLGLKLCRRGRAGFGLTDRGKEVHALTAQLFKNHQEFRSQVDRLVSRVGGELTVVMDDDFTFGVQGQLTQVIRSFHAAHPDVFFTLRTGSAKHVAQLVLEGSADLGIGAIPRIVPEVSIHPLFEETMTLYCGARHPLFARSDSQITRKMVANFECVDVTSLQDAKARAATEKMRVRARAATIHARMLLVLSGSFLAFLPADFARRWVQLGAMRPVLPSELSYQHTCFAIVKKEASISAACEYFLEDLKRVFTRGQKVEARKSPELR